MTVSSVNLSKKNGVITGSFSGIVRACALIITRLGAHATLVAQNLDRLRETMIINQVFCFCTYPSSTPSLHHTIFLYGECDDLSQIFQ